MDKILREQKINELKKSIENIRIDIGYCIDREIELQDEYLEGANFNLGMAKKPWVYKRHKLEREMLKLEKKMYSLMKY